MYLMLKDEPVLEIDLKVTNYKIINKTLLPLPLYSLHKIYNVDGLRNWLSNRFIYTNFKNYKMVVDSISDIDIQSETKLAIALKCHAVAVTDCYWVKVGSESFNDIFIHKQKIADVVIDSALLGLLSTLTINDLNADVDIQGTFPKTWKRMSDGLHLLKTDTNNYNNVYAELYSQKILDKTTIPNCHYKASNYKGALCTDTKCFTDENTMLFTFAQMHHFFESNNINYKKYFKYQLAEMAYIDFITGNIDRHLNNFGFLISANDNSILGFAPLYDFNMSMNVTQMFNEKLQAVVYKPTGKSFLESAVAAMNTLGDTVPLEFNNVPQYVTQRLNVLKDNIKSNKIFIPDTHFGITQNIAHSHNIDWYDMQACKKLSKELYDE